MRILLAEDEEDLNVLIHHKLEKEGLAVDACSDGTEAWEFLQLTSYDAAVLDINMPGIDGFTLLRKMRSKGLSTPVIFLTARDSVEDRVEGLDLGAADYLTKPFHFPELMARIRVLLRGKTEAVTSVFRCEDLTVDVSRHQVTRDGILLDLSSREFAVLEYLIRNKEHVVSRQQIEDHVWSYDYEGASNMIDVYISYLRRKIDQPFAYPLIHTVRGAGYVLRKEEKN